MCGSQDYGRTGIIQFHCQSHLQATQCLYLQHHMLASNHTILLSFGTQDAHLCVQVLAATVCKSQVVRCHGLHHRCCSPCLLDAQAPSRSTTLMVQHGKARRLAAQRAQESWVSHMGPLGWLLSPSAVRTVPIHRSPFVHHHVGSGQAASPVSFCTNQVGS